MRRCRCGDRPARSPRRCSRATRTIPAPRTTSCTPTITSRWRARSLPAARAYAKIAPAASHALHMPAHAFLQAGFWDEAAAADEASWNASIAWAKRRGLPITSRDFHSLSWLQYEWTQQGRFSKTREAIAFVNRGDGRVSLRQGDGGTACYSVAPARWRTRLRREVKSGGGAVWPRYATIAARCARATSSTSERWSEMKGQTTFDNIDELFALGLSAVNLGDAARVRSVIERIPQGRRAVAACRAARAGGGDAARDGGARSVRAGPPRRGVCA